MNFSDLKIQHELNLVTPFQLTPPPKPVTKRTKKQTIKTGNRQDIIKNCQQCNGCPRVEPLNVPGFTGTKCGDCMEVIEYATTPK